MGVAVCENRVGDAGVDSDTDSDDDWISGRQGSWRNRPSLAKPAHPPASSSKDGRKGESAILVNDSSDDEDTLNTSILQPQEFLGDIFPGYRCVPPRARPSIGPRSARPTQSHCGQLLLVIQSVVAYVKNPGWIGPVRTPILDMRQSWSSKRSEFSPSVSQ